ncbi:MAG: SAM-dependent methyltransferase [Rhodothermales bacterium]
MDRDLRDALARAEDRHWWFEGRRRILRSVLTRIEACGPLVEVGCGNGANLEMLAEFGALTGIEPFAEDRDRAASRGIGQVIPGSLPDRMPAGRSFQTVLALDVIEHVEEELLAAETLARLVAPGGHLVVTVPAYQWMWSDHDVRNGHFRRYSRASLRGLLQKTGLRVDRVSYFNSFLLPPIAAVRVLGRFGGLSGAGTSLPPEAVNRVLMKLLAFESRLLARFNLPAGVSLMAVATRA